MPKAFLQLIIYCKLFYILGITLFALSYKLIPSTLLTPLSTAETKTTPPYPITALNGIDSQHYSTSEPKNNNRSLKTTL